MLGVALALVLVLVVCLGATGAAYLLVKKGKWKHRYSFAALFYLAFVFLAALGIEAYRSDWHDKCAGPGPFQAYCVLGSGSMERVPFVISGLNLLVLLGIALFFYSGKKTKAYLLEEIDRKGFLRRLILLYTLVAIAIPCMMLLGAGFYLSYPIFFLATSL